MEKSPSSKSSSSSDSHESPRTLWNQKIHHRIHNSAPLVPILTQLKTIHILTAYSLRFVLILSAHLDSGLPSSLYPLRFLKFTNQYCIHRDIKSKFLVGKCLISFASQFRLLVCYLRIKDQNKKF